MLVARFVASVAAALVACAQIRPALPPCFPGRADFRTCRPAAADVAVRLRALPCAESPVAAFRHSMLMSMSRCYATSCWLRRCCFVALVLVRVGRRACRRAFFSIRRCVFRVFFSCFFIVLSPIPHTNGPPSLHPYLLGVPGYRLVLATSPDLFPG